MRKRSFELFHELSLKNVPSIRGKQKNKTRNTENFLKTNKESNYFVCCYFDLILRLFFCLHTIEVYRVRVSTASRLFEGEVGLSSLWLWFYGSECKIFDEKQIKRNFEKVSFNTIHSTRHTHHSHLPESFSLLHEEKPQTHRIHLGIA